MREEKRVPLVVVGVDGSDVSEAVLRWARNQAKATGGRLRVVFGWHVTDQSRDVPLRIEAELDTAAQDRVADLVARAAPDVRVERVVEETAPADLLLREAKGADLLVLGSVGHGGTGAQPRGSVVRACLDRATCPVVVVPVAQSV
jgi:nucleotide-binding universal stress UspA family protein